MSLFDFKVGDQTIAALIWLFVLSFIQNVSFSVVSRSRNRNNMTYHMIASVFSNGIWFLTFRELVRADMTFIFFVPYTIGTVLGSISGAKVSMWIERQIGAVADADKQKPLVYADVTGIMALENLRQDLYHYGNYSEVGPSDAFIRAVRDAFNVELDPKRCANDSILLYNEILRLTEEKKQA